MKTSFLYGIVACSKTRVRCVFCGVHIPKANKCIEQHTNGVKHKENMELMKENGISFNDNALYCKPCKLVLPVDESVHKHVEGDDHANWMAAMEDLIEGEFINLDSYMSSEKDKEDVYCEACKSSLACTLLGLEEHVNAFSHRANLSEKLRPLNAIFPVENDDEVWCKVCDVYIENTVKDILDHVDHDDQHIEWFAEIEDLLLAQDISIEDYLSNDYEDKAFCNKCSVKILCNLPTLEEHIMSETHLSQFI